jgi:hypothetical protein
MLPDECCIFFPKRGTFASTVKKGPSLKWKGAVPFHFKVPICDLWESGKIYDIDSCRDYICGLKH